MNNLHDKIAHPFLIEPMALANDLTLYCSIRFVSEAFLPDEPLNISAAASSVIDRGIEGELFIDIWADDEGVHRCGAAVFTIGREVMSLDQHEIRGDWTGAGLLFLMIAMAQNVMGWSRYVIGVNELGGW